MIRSPLLAKRSPGVQKSHTKSLPAPTGGWNARDPLADMPAKDAVLLDNWFPKASDVELRPGCQARVTGFAAAVQTLLPWNGPSSKKLFAATVAGIYDVTASGTVGSSLSALTSGYLQHTNFQTSAGQFLVAVNGQDKLKLYNGSTWADIDSASVPAITGLATTSLSNVAVACARLWFVQKNSTSAWYLPVAQIAGALTEFPLGAIFTRGGHLVTIGTWTIDGGSGSDDFVVFLSSEGEAAVYQGTDPADISTFRKVGVYYIGEPLGKNCLAKFGGDLLVLCRTGLFPLSKALQSASSSNKDALTGKIETAFLDAAAAYGDNHGWRIVVYPQGNFLLVNIPVTASYTVQYVMNVVTGAWTRFLGWLANDWLVFDKSLFFASSDRVVKAWTGRSDMGAAIVGRAQQAYNTFGIQAAQKYFRLVRPTLTLDGPVTIEHGFDTDYVQTAFSSLSTASPVNGYVYDNAGTLWDRVSWGPSHELRRDWATTFTRECYAAAFRLQVSTTSVNLRWASTDFVFQVGGVL